MADKKIRYAKHTSLSDVVEDGFEKIKNTECTGFDYVVGYIRGGQIKVVFEPFSDDYLSGHIDGATGAGHCLLAEED